MDVSTIADLIISLMASAEKTNMGGSYKKEWVLNEIAGLSPQFYKDHSVMIGYIIDGFVLVASNPKMIQSSKNCFIKLCGC